MIAMARKKIRSNGRTTGKIGSFDFDSGFVVSSVVDTFVVAVVVVVVGGGGVD